jgi:hypothetical protein
LPGQARQPRHQHYVHRVRLQQELPQHSPLGPEVRLPLGLQLHRDRHDRRVRQLLLHWLPVRLQQELLRRLLPEVRHHPVRHRVQLRLGMSCL